MIIGFLFRHIRVMLTSRVVVEREIGSVYIRIVQTLKTQMHKHLNSVYMLHISVCSLVTKYNHSVLRYML